MSQGDYDDDYDYDYEEESLDYDSLDFAELLDEPRDESPRGLFLEMQRIFGGNQELSSIDDHNVELAANHPINPSDNQDLSDQGDNSSQQEDNPSSAVLQDFSCVILDKQFISDMRREGKELSGIRNFRGRHELSSELERSDLVYSRRGDGKDLDGTLSRLVAKAGVRNAGDDSSVPSDDPGPNGGSSEYEKAARRHLQHGCEFCDLPRIVNDDTVSHRIIRMVCRNYTRRLEPSTKHTQIVSYKYLAYCLEHHFQTC